MASADLVFSKEVAKYASRNVCRVNRKGPDTDDLLYLANKQMILQVLGDSACLEELTVEEREALEGVLILKS